MSFHLTTQGANTVEVLQYTLHKEARKAREFIVHAALHTRQMQSDDLHLLFRADECCGVTLSCVTKTFTGRILEQALCSLMTF